MAGKSEPMGTTYGGDFGVATEVSASCWHDVQITLAECTSSGLLHRMQEPEESTVGLSSMRLPRLG